MSESVLITREMINQGKSPFGGWNAEQLAVLGLVWPPPKGWIDGLVGKAVTKQDWERFLKLRKTYR